MKPRTRMNRRPFDLESEILRECSKEQCLRIAGWVGNDRGRFRELMKLFLKGEYRTTQRTAWIVGHCAEAHRELILPYLNPMLERMLEPGVHAAVKRNVVRTLQNVEIPRSLAGKVATICFDMLASEREPIAVKVFSMTVLAHLAEREPDFKNELRILIERGMINGSAGFRSRGTKILKKLAARPAGEKSSAALL